MSDPSRPFPSNEPLDDFWFEPYIAACATVADEIGLFGSIGFGSVTLEGLASLLGSQVDLFILDPLCRVLVSRGFLAIDSGKFLLTELSKAYWLPESELYRGETLRLRRSWTVPLRLKSALMRRSAPAIDGDRPLVDQWLSGHLSEKTAREQSRAMHQIMVPAAKAFGRSHATSGIEHLLDLGGGLGTFAAEFVTNHPKKRATVFDLPTIEPFTRDFIARRSLSERIDFVGGDFFASDWIDATISSSVGRRYKGCFDAILMSNILHDWNVEVGMQLLKKVYEQLPRGGLVLVHEMLLNEGRVSPEAAVAFDLMIRISVGGQQYTFSQLTKILTSVGFHDISSDPTAGYYTLVQATK